MTRRPIHVLNGPNLNLLGMRQPEIYGYDTLEDIEALCRSVAAGLGFDIVFRQSNHEGELLEMVQDARTDAAGIVISPAANTHTSLIIRDAFASCNMPIYEIHISNVHRREAFRHHSYVSGVATGVIAGLGIYGYAAALHAFLNVLPVSGDRS